MLGVFTALFAGALGVTMFGLVVRARREERDLEAQYGRAWQAYAARVPAWLPRNGRRDTHRCG